MSAPVTAEELAAAERCAKSLLSIFPYHAEHAGFGGVSRDFHALAVTATERAAELLPRLARDLATARASIRNLIESLNTAQTDRDAIGDRCLDLGRELEALRAAVRVHEERRRAGWPTPNPWNQADLDLWAAGKA